MTEEGKEKDKIKVLLVSNISMSATKDQVFTMFQYVGRIEEMKIYPSEANIQLSTTRKSAFIRFDDERAVEVGQHLSNIVLIDQALNCIPWRQGSIPDEQTFLNSGDVTGLGERQLPPHVTNRVQDAGDGTKALLTIDPTLEQLGLPAYPPLPADTDQAKVEEIRRTVYVGNLPKGIDGQKVLDFFNCYVGEVMYLRMATGPDSLPCAYAYIEFSQQPSVPVALQNNGLEFEGRPLKIVHSRVAIIKPQQKTDAQALEEIEDAIRMGKTGGGDRDSRSPRRSSRRSRSRDRRRSRSPRRRSRSRDRKRSRSRDRRRDRSRSRDRKRSRSRDRKDRKRSRSRDRDRDSKRDHKRERREKENDSSRRDSEEDEEKLRERLLAKKAERNGKSRTKKNDSSDEWEEAK